MSTQRVVELAQAYRHILNLSTPFKETRAYALGIIDEDGTVLRMPRRGELQESDLVYNTLKRELLKLPANDRRRYLFATAFFLVREQFTGLSEVMTQNVPLLRRSVFEMPSFDKYLSEASGLLEDAPANAAGAGGVAGLTGDPPVSQRRKKGTYGS